MTKLSKSLREQVQRRAKGRCEYCQKPETYSAQSYHVDHIISRKHKGTNALDNLAWACFQCNTCKGTDIAAVDAQTGLLTPLYNPRTQNREDHFELREGIIIGKTSIGRVTVELLQLNHPDQVETRRLLIESDLWV
jgi:5-methylcytosine-specific restriction endonuclease McrA